MSPKNIEKILKILLQAKNIEYIENIDELNPARGIQGKVKTATAATDASTSQVESAWSKLKRPAGCCHQSL